MLAVGLMSGTSLDGIDAALVRIAPSGPSYALELLAFTTVPFSVELDAHLRAALPPNRADARMLAELDHALGTAFARAARTVSGALAVGYVASHGQTIYHDGARHVTTQLGDAFVMRESLNTTICYDFRRADCAVGGHGAPLVPYVDALLFANAEEDRVALNIGGIANMTALPRGSETYDVNAFDCGPGVMLIDALVRARTEGEMTMDEDGRFASEGIPDAGLVEAMLEDPYFGQSPPKSTGRERFGEQFLRRFERRLNALSLPDAAATLTELTAASVAESIASVSLRASRVLCSGGGARNLALMRRLAELLPGASIETTDAYGIPGDAKEAIAFAVFGYETLRERAANVPRVTGAARAVPLGAIAPHALKELLTEIEAECQSS